MKKNKKVWSWALAGALAVSNLSAVAMPFTSIVAQAAVSDPTITGLDTVTVGSTISLTPGITVTDEETIKSVAWTTSNANYATVTNNTDGTDATVVTGIAPGEVTIEATITCEDKSGQAIQQTYTQTKTITVVADQTKAVKTNTEGNMKIWAVDADHAGNGAVYCNPAYEGIKITGTAVAAQGTELVLKETTSGVTDTGVSITGDGNEQTVTKRLGVDDIKVKGTRTFTLINDGTPIGTIELNLVERKVLETKSDFTGKYSFKDVTGSIFTGATATVGATINAIDKSEYVSPDATFFFKDSATSSPLTIVGDAAEYGTSGKEGKKLEFTQTFTANKAGVYTLNLMYDPDGGNESNAIAIASNDYEVVASKLTQVTVSESKDKAVIVNNANAAYTEYGNKLNLTALATADDITGMPDDVAWDVFKASDTKHEKTMLSTNSFAYGTPTNSSLPSKLSFQSVVTLTAGNSVETGEYVAVATAKKTTSEGTTELEPVGTYPFSVVAIPTTETVAIVDNKDDTATTFFKGETGKAKLYLNNALNDTAKFKLDDPADAEYVKLNENGSFEILKSPTAQKTVKVVAKSATLEKGVQYVATANAFGNIAIVPDAFTATWNVAKYTVTPQSGGTATVELPVGTELSIAATFGIEDVTNKATYKSSNSKLLSVDASGNVKALEESEAPVTITATYGEATPVVLKVDKIVGASYSLYEVKNGKVEKTPIADQALRPGKSVTVRLVADNGQPIADDITWDTSSASTAIINGNGNEVTIEVPSTARVGAKATISAYVGEVKSTSNPVDDFEVTVAEAKYTLEGNGEEIVLNPQNVATVNLVSGDTLALTVLYDGEEVDGTWAYADSTNSPNKDIILKGNEITVTGTSAVQNKNAVEFTVTGEKAKLITVKVDVVSDSYALYQDGKKLANLAPTITSMEIGDSIAFTIKNGTKDVTGDLYYESSNPAISVEDGVLVANSEYTSPITVKAYAKKGDMQPKVTVTVNSVIASTGASEDAAAAEDAAAEAISSADAATEAAATAAEAAEATKKAPTAENLAKAEDALKTANKNLEDAQAALAAAEDALAQAEADGAKSAVAMKAVEDAKEAVETAEKAVADAEKNVTAAQKTFDEAASEVEKAKKAEEEKKKQEEEQKKSDGSAAGIPAAAGTELKDANGNATGFVVTDATASAPTVEYKGTDADKKATKLTIPATVKDHSGNTYTVTSIAKNAFKNDKKLTKVTIPSSIKEIKAGAFKNAKNLKKVTINAGGKLKVAKSAFKGLKKGSTIKVKGSNKKANIKTIKKAVTASKTTVK